MKHHSFYHTYRYFSVQDVCRRNYVYKKISITSSGIFANKTWKERGITQLPVKYDFNKSSFLEKRKLYISRWIMKTGKGG